MLRASRFTGFVLAALATFSGVVAPIASQASEEGRRNTTYGLGALAAGLLLTQRNKLPGIVAGAGAVYAYSQLHNDIMRRHRRERAAAYYYGYSRGASYSRYRQASNYGRHHRRVLHRYYTYR